MNEWLASERVGHDEYGSVAERDAVETARNDGVSLGFLSANAGYWRVRLEPSSDGVGDVDERPEWTWSEERIARADEHASAAVVLPEELLDEGSLADPRFAGDEDDPSATVTRLVELLMQVRDLVVPLEDVAQGGGRTGGRAHDRNRPLSQGAAQLRTTLASA